MKKTPTHPKTRDKQEISISLSPDIARGIYCNLAAISHSEREFVFDFIFQAQNQGQVVSRIITNPQHAKALARALNDNISKYEAQHAEISDETPQPTPIIRH